MNGKSEKDLISIIVPVYKVEPYLNQCVESLIRQTYSNLEIILVDDGSPDVCGRMCDEWALRDSRIIVVHQQNKGLSGARNTGLKICRGHYLMFVDSDDYVELEYVERLYLRLTEQDADVAMCGFSYLSENNSFEHVVILERESTVKNSIGALLGLESGGNRKIFYTVVWNKIYKRALWEKLRFPEGKICEDEFVMPLLYELCGKVAFVNEGLYMYRKREGSISEQQGKGFMDAQFAAREEREKLYQRVGSRELLVLHEIHVYSMLDYFGISDVQKKKNVQKKIRKFFFCYKYVTKVSFIRRMKDLLAIINLPFYQKLVNIRNTD